MIGPRKSNDVNTQRLFEHSSGLMFSTLFVFKGPQLLQQASEPK